MAAAGRASPALDAELLWRTLAAVAGAWTIAECVLVVLEAAETEGRSHFAVAPGTVVDFVRVVGAGRLGAVTVACTALVTLIAAVATAAACRGRPRRSSR